MGIFDGIDKVDAAGSQSRYFNDGKYEVEISKFSQGVSKKGKGPFVVIEGTITKVLAEYANSNVVGETVSQVIMMRHGELALKNIKAFVAAAAGVDVADVNPDVCEKASGGDGTLLAGATVVADAQTIQTKAGHDFTKVAWSAS